MNRWFRPKSVAFLASASLLFALSGISASMSAPLPTGACCNKFTGCCAPTGSCRDAISGECNGIADVFLGDQTTCAGTCSATTTTLPPFGACCLPDGNCVTDEPSVCAVNEGVFQGDGTTCDDAQCPVVTTTLPLIGACCLPLGTCVIHEPLACAIIEGTYQGNGTTCENTECPNPTTTTITSTTTITLPSVLCGDANDDAKITAPDALIALKTSVGTAQCIPQRCDYNGNGLIQGSDALLILKVSVKFSIEPHCPSSTNTTSSTTSSTSSTTTSTTSTTTTTIYSCGECPANPPYGSYIDTCASCSVADCKLSCYCADQSTNPAKCHHDPASCHATELDLRYCNPVSGIGNDNGNLTCTACVAPECGGWTTDPAGSYANSCINCGVTDCKLSCTCATSAHSVDDCHFDPELYCRDTMIDLYNCDPAYDLGNNDGYLSCTPH